MRLIALLLLAQGLSGFAVADELTEQQSKDIVAIRHYLEIKYDAFEILPRNAGEDGAEAADDEFAIYDFAFLPDAEVRPLSIKEIQVYAPDTRFYATTVVDPNHCFVSLDVPILVSVKTLDEKIELRSILLHSMGGESGPTRFLSQFEDVKIKSDEELKHFAVVLVELLMASWVDFPGPRENPHYVRDIGFVKHEEGECEIGFGKQSYYARGAKKERAAYSLSVRRYELDDELRIAVFPEKSIPEDVRTENDDLKAIGVHLRAKYDDFELDQNRTAKVFGLSYGAGSFESYFILRDQEVMEFVPETRFYQSTLTPPPDYPRDRVTVLISARDLPYRRDVRSAPSIASGSDVRRFLRQFESVDLGETKRLESFTTALANLLLIPLRADEPEVEFGIHVNQHETAECEVSLWRKDKDADGQSRERIISYLHVRMLPNSESGQFSEISISDQRIAMRREPDRVK